MKTVKTSNFPGLRERDSGNMNIEGSKADNRIPGSGVAAIGE